ncbi:MAG TPA: inositol monophosphatase family protein, partial [Beijerinckiaceae bacterium]|nr:inositol monophosphatase family protein [Beijerinckiaceae bacterium]
MRPEDPDAVALQLAAIAVEAGDLLQRMQDAAGEHRIKTDGTPTTAADVAAERLILSRLKERWPGIPVIAEETANQAAPGERFFLVDPLDGTRDYIHGSREYSVNIAL